MKSFQVVCLFIYSFQQNKEKTCLANSLKTHDIKLQGMTKRGKQRESDRCRKEDIKSGRTSKVEEFMTLRSHCFANIFIQVIICIKYVHVNMELNGSLITFTFNLYSVSAGSSLHLRFDFAHIKVKTGQYRV